MILEIFFFLWTFNESNGALRVFGGRHALKDEFPYAVRLENKELVSKGGKQYEKYKSFCSGAAITPTWILSAGHCADMMINKFSYIFKFDNSSIVARYNSYLPGLKGNVTPILDFVICPAYELTSSFFIVKSDFALFRCEHIKVSRYAKVSAVDYTNLVGHEVVAIGFGRTNASEDTYPLQVMEAILIQCTENGKVLVATLCAVPSCQNKAQLCSGDSGGPVMHSSGIVGVNSMASMPCESYILGVSKSMITMISPVIDWITNTINANK